MVWWEGRTEGDMKRRGKTIFVWSEFVSTIKRKFYPLDYMQQAMMSWQTLRQLKGKSVQGYTQEFRKKAMILGISLDSLETLLKYIGGLHSYMRHTILMFNPTSIDEVSVQATHLEDRGKNGSLEVGDHLNQLQARIRRKESRNGKQGRLTLHRKPKLYKKDGHDD